MKSRQCSVLGRRKIFLKERTLIFAETVRSPGFPEQKGIVGPEWFGTLIPRSSEALKG